jgi:geranylgeranyl diphosphate synthase type I
MTIAPHRLEPVLAGLIADIDRELRRVLDDATRRAPDRDHALIARVYRSLYAYLDNGGRRLHGASQLLAWRAVGGATTETILPVVAGFQLYHHHTLVHDDIYDDDARRRGSPTIVRAFADWFAAGGEPAGASPGTDEAVFRSDAARRGAVAGFAQGKIVHAIAFDAILGAPLDPAELLAAARALNWHDLHDSAAQMIDVYHEGSRIPRIDGCVEIARKKTGRLFGVGAEVIARLGKASPGQRAALVEWATALGVAYQLQDDLEDLEHDSEKGTGRGVGTDLRTAKPTLVMALALDRASPRDRQRLEDWLTRPDLRAAEHIDEIAGIVHATGAPAACRAHIEALVATGARALEAADPALDPAVVPDLIALADYGISPAYWRRALPPPRHPFDEPAR